MLALQPMRLSLDTFSKAVKRHLLTPSSGTEPYYTNVPSRPPSHGLHPSERSFNNIDKDYVVKIVCWHSTFMPACLPFEDLCLSAYNLMSQSWTVCSFMCVQRDRITVVFYGCYTGRYLGFSLEKKEALPVLHSALNVTPGLVHYI